MAPLLDKYYESAKYLIKTNSVDFYVHSLDALNAKGEIMSRSKIVLKYYHVYNRSKVRLSKSVI